MMTRKQLGHVEIRQGGVGTEGGELNGSGGAVPVRVVAKRAGCGVIDDPVVGIVSGTTSKKRSRIQRSRMGNCDEHGLVKLDFIVGCIEVHDGVDVAGGVEGRIEHEDVVSAETKQRI